ncbi:MAG: hemolysin family protein [Treponema sp.]|nr:hemolysin family protein [Treponema sp.]
MENPGSNNLALIISLVALLCFSAFFSFCEMAFSALNRIKLKNMALKSGRARLALKMLDMYDKVLSSVLIGNNIVNIVASALATVLFVSLFGAKGVSIAAVVLSLVVLLFCDISPKALAKESPEMTAIRTAPLLSFLLIIFTPLNYFTAFWKKIIMKIFPAKMDRSITENELLTFVEEVAQEGGINKQEEEMIRQAIEFDDITAGDIFTPRIDVAAVSENDTAEEIDRKFTETGFSRLPVFRDSIDNITGVILLKDFYHLVSKGVKTPLEIVKPAALVTKTMKITKLLRTLQQKHAHLAVVVDEFGGTLGIITLEDIVEELVGEIWDEHDEVVESIKAAKDGSFFVMGNVNFIDMYDFLGIKNSTEDIPDTTIGNWIMEKSGRLPQTGEEYLFHDIIIRVSKILQNRVMEVIVSFKA